MSPELRKPVALVTGGRQGIGRAAAFELAFEGFDLLIADIHDDATAQSTVRELRSTGANVHFLQCDIANIDTHPAFVEQAWSHYGYIDCLVNNAGIAARPVQDVLEIAPQHFDVNFDVNIRGTFFLTQALARRMIEDVAPAAYRSIVVVSSMAAHYALTSRAQYCMSKAALAMMAKIFAIRLASHGIHVHDVRPGLTKTEMTQSLDTKGQNARIESGEIPLRRWGEARDVGRLIATLATGRLPYMTGEPFVIDGGLRANSP